MYILMDMALLICAIIYILSYFFDNSVWMIFLVIMILIRLVDIYIYCWMIAWQYMF